MSVGRIEKIGAASRTGLDAAVMGGIAEHEASPLAAFVHGG
ncbi:MAG: hypothetical protein OXG37_10715 [Actinomycetia bacterium]|nr:hypothetical protein [Actinomycetes bacterium]